MHVKDRNFVETNKKCRNRRTADIAEVDVGEFYCAKKNTKIDEGVEKSACNNTGRR